MSEVYSCQVEVLDGSTVAIDISKRTVGEVLLTEVFKHLGLDENDYFGLQYLDSKDQVHWLDPMKAIKKQVKTRSGDFVFRFRVKLYPVSTTYIFDEVTRYFLSLQIKEDLVNMKLVCSEETYGVLAGYVVQGEFGDYDPLDHTPGYLEDFPFLENRSPELRSKVEEFHQRNRGLLPAECDRRFLDLACRIDRYGMDFHKVLDISSIGLQMGVSGKGVTVFCGQHPNFTPLNNFPWVHVAAVNFRSKQLQLEMISPSNQNYTEVIMFTCPSRKACKTLWKSCVEHHTFFRTVKTELVKRPSTNSLFRRGSTFRFSGRTQFRLLQEGTQSKKRRSSARFERISSRNKFSRKTM